MQNATIISFNFIIIDKFFMLYNLIKRQRQNAYATYITTDFIKFDNHLYDWNNWKIQL